MNKIFKFGLALCLPLLLLSCEKETEGVSFETHYAVFEKEGGTVLHQLGEPFVDPGISATENGEPVEINTLVTGLYSGYSGSSVDVTTPDYYTMNYSATNSDGYIANESRDVYVFNNGDLTNSIEGLYTSTVVRNGASSAQYTDMKYVMITKIGDNKYELTCGIGAYYQIGRKYGIDYAAKVEITANDIAANDFSFGPCEVPAFGGAVTFNSFTVDPATKTINFTSVWNVYTFVVKLKQVQL